jgi:hypothetical protein
MELRIKELVLKNFARLPPAQVAQRVEDLLVWVVNLLRLTAVESEILREIALEAGDLPHAETGSQGC